jgi:hypothetical protein
VIVDWHSLSSGLCPGVAAVVLWFVESVVLCVVVVCPWFRRCCAVLNQQKNSERSEQLSAYSKQPTISQVDQTATQARYVRKFTLSYVCFDAANMDRIISFPMKRKEKVVKLTGKGGVGHKTDAPFDVGRPTPPLFGETTSLTKPTFI